MWAWGYLSLDPMAIGNHDRAAQHVYFCHTHMHCIGGNAPVACQAVKLEQGA